MAPTLTLSLAPRILEDALNVPGSVVIRPVAAAAVALFWIKSLLFMGFLVLLKFGAES
jgi:hypothetical protein